jgi:hypothetical protein
MGTFESTRIIAIPTYIRARSREHGLDVGRRARLLECASNRSELVFDVTGRRLPPSGAQRSPDPLSDRESLHPSDAFHFPPLLFVQ